MVRHYLNLTTERSAHLLWRSKAPFDRPPPPPHPFFGPADNFIWKAFATGQRNLARTQSRDGSCAKNDLQYVSPGLFAYQCQWKVLHCEGRANAAFTCDRVRERLANKLEQTQSVLQGSSARGKQSAYAGVAGELAIRQRLHNDSIWRFFFRILRP